jgi:hypothetical protein
MVLVFVYMYLDTQNYRGKKDGQVHTKQIYKAILQLGLILVYDQKQIDLVGTLQDVENWFVKTTKRIYVGQDYIQQLESLMEKIHQIVWQAPNTKPFAEPKLYTANTKNYTQLIPKTIHS